MLKKAWIVFLSLGFLLPVLFPKIALADLEKYLTVEAAILQANENISLYFEDANGEKVVAMDPTRSWIPASTVKAYVLVEVTNQVRQGLISFDQIVTINKQNVVATALESDDFPRLREGTQASIRQLAEAMIIQSDNTAYNTLLDILDRRHINTTLRSLGITETVIGEKLNLDDDQFQIDSQVPGHQSNTTTAKDFSHLFFLLANNKIPGSTDMLAIFKRERFNDMIPALIPKSVAVAHKPGFWAPIYHDGGIVYKPDEPFILSIFSNANDPSINARLAKVAYFQNADSVSLSNTLENGQNQSYRQTDYPTITLAKIPNDQETSRVLAATDAKFPQVTAADLGISSKDLTIGQEDNKNVTPALINPKGLLYPLKTAFERLRLRLAQNDAEKTSVLLDIARARLSEIKALKKSGDGEQVASLVKQSEEVLAQTVATAKNLPDAQSQLAETKQISDLSFTTAGEGLDHVKGAEKEKLIDQIYASHKKSKLEIAPAVQKSLPTSPFNQPLVGTVKEISEDKVTIAFDDGSSKEVLIGATTPSRSFGQNTTSHGAQNLSVGGKIAVIGETTKDGKIVPNFILRNVPKEVPEKKTGIVVKIDSQAQSLDIKEQSGKTETISVNEDTTIKGKDTNVSLTGIKAGSTVTVFTTPLTTTTATPGKIPATATTITVTKNSSGKDEKIEKKSEIKEKAKPAENQKDKKDKNKKD